MNEARTSKTIRCRGFLGVTGRTAGDMERELMASSTPFGSPVQPSYHELGLTKLRLFPREEENSRREIETKNLLAFTGRPFQGDRLLQSTGLQLPLEVGELDGKFGGIMVLDDRLILFTDCIGAGSIYYSRQAEATFFSSHLGLLLGILPRQPQLNELGVVAQLAGRSQIFDETHFTGVFRLPAGQTLEVTPAGAELTGGVGDWISTLLAFYVPAFDRNTFWTMMDQGVRREEYGTDSILMYSGGRDSTAIALARGGRPTRAATYGEVYSIDRVRGLKRAGKLGLASIPIPYENWNLDSYRAQIVGLHGGCSGLQTNHNIHGFSWMANTANNAAVGFLGDALTGAHSGPACAPDGAYALSILLPSHRDPVLSRVYERELGSVRDHVLDRFEDMKNEFGPRTALMLLDLKWRQARWISMMFDLCDWFLPVSYPFMQRRLISACLQASDDALRGQRDYDLALAERLEEKQTPGFNPDSRLSRFLVRLQTGLQARRRSRPVVGRCDWPAVMARTKFDATHYSCDNPRLDTLTADSWAEWLSIPGRRATNIPVAFASAPIGAAARGDWI